MRLIQAAMSTFSLAFFTACGANGILDLNPKPNGNIAFTNATTGAPIMSTFKSPYMVGPSSFAIGLAENSFPGPYDVAVISWTAPFNIPCYAAQYVNQDTKTNVITFSPVNATPVTALTQPSPCNPFISRGVTQTDEQTARINDNDGHTITFYDKISP